MRYLIKYSKLVGILLCTIMICAMLFGILNLIGVSCKVTEVLSIIMMILLFFIFGIIEGLNTTKKGFVAGFKIGLLFIALLIIINLILFRTPFTLSRLIYYIALLFSSILGAMIGINRKKKE